MAGRKSPPTTCGLFEEGSSGRDGDEGKRKAKGGAGRGLALEASGGVADHVAESWCHVSFGSREGSGRISVGIQ